MQWKRYEDEISLQQKIELQETIDELCEQMQIPKRSYNQMKKVIHCEDDWRVKNHKGKDSGTL